MSTQVKAIAWTYGSGGNNRVEVSIPSKLIYIHNVDSTMDGFVEITYQDLPSLLIALEKALACLEDSED